MTQRGFAMARVIELQVIEIILAAQRNRQSALAKAVLEAVDGDQLLDADAVILEASFQGVHLHDVLAQPLALDVALYAHRFGVIVFVDAANDRRRGSHRSDDAGEHKREHSDRHDHPSSIKEDVADVATDVAGDDLNFDHAGSMSLARDGCAQECVQWTKVPCAKIAREQVPKRCGK